MPIIPTSLKVIRGVGMSLIIVLAASYFFLMMNTVYNGPINFNIEGHYFYVETRPILGKTRIFYNEYGLLDFPCGIITPAC